MASNFSIHHLVKDIHRGRFAENVDASTPKLIFLDLDMPRKDGFEALGEIIIVVRSQYNVYTAVTCLILYSPQPGKTYSPLSLYSSHSIHLWHLHDP